MGTFKTYFGTWAAVTAVLFLLRKDCDAMVFITTGFLSLFVADLLVKTTAIYLDTRHFMTDVRSLAVFITGCETGFGNMLATRLADRGFKVYAGCLSAESAGAQQLAEHDRIQVIQLDVCSEDQISAAVEAVKRDLKSNGLQLWSVVNNAGIAVMGETEIVPMGDFRRVIEVNSFGPVAVTRSFLPLLRANGKGRIVNIASMAGRFTMFGFTPYSMSKHALVAFSDGLRVEMRKWNISVHSVEPALYKTNIADAAAIRAVMERQWQAAGEEVRAAYGEAYFAAAVDSICGGSAKPAVWEVVDDMEDAVAGLDPQVRYTPNNYTKKFVRILREMPWSVIDNVCGKSHPAVKPAQA